MTIRFKKITPKYALLVFIAIAIGMAVDCVIFYLLEHEWNIWQALGFAIVMAFLFTTDVKMSKG